MMSASKSKAALKAIAAAIQASKYSDAIDQAQILLSEDPKNYQACVLFLALCEPGTLYYVLCPQ